MTKVPELFEIFLDAIENCCQCVYESIISYATVRSTDDTQEATHPKIDVELTFAGSQVLRLQLEQGAHADRWAASNSAWRSLGRLVVDPNILLLDESLAAMDATARRKPRRFLAERLRRHARPSIVVTHDLRDVIALDARVCVLEHGKTVRQASVAELRVPPATDFVAKFVGAA